MSTANRLLRLGSQRVSPTPSDLLSDAIRDMMAELGGIRAELVKQNRLLDEFFRVYLNARFPHGQPDDRWRRRG